MQNYGVKILFEDNMIREFIQEDTYDEVIYHAILNHNKYQLPNELKGKALLHSKLIRDADKTDIFRVNINEPLEAVLGLSKEEFQHCNIEHQAISPKVYQDVMNKKCTSVSDWNNEMDSWVGNLSFMFDYNFIKGIQIVKQKRYIEKMVARIHYQNPDTRDKMRTILGFIQSYMNERCNQSVRVN